MPPHRTNGGLTVTVIDNAIVAPKLGYGISDADQHFYEAPDSFTKYLDPT